MTRDAEQQRQHLVDLRSLEQDAEVVKRRAIEAQVEAGANLMLAFQCAADGIAEELAMWLALKDGQPDRAWDHLVSAQEANDAVLRLGVPFGALEARGQKLRLLEVLVFPPQVFMSAGCIVHAADCSICGSDYEDCGHVAGRAYWGRFCAMVPRSIEADHVALVEVPADKRCRAVFFSDDGWARSRMTWKLTGEPLPEHVFQGVLMSVAGRWGRIQFASDTLSAAAGQMMGRPVTGGWTASEPPEGETTQADADRPKRTPALMGSDGMPHRQSSTLARDTNG